MLDGVCRLCSAKCKKCGSSSTNCTAWCVDSVLVGEDCNCISPHVRNPTTLKCEENCPTGFDKPNGGTVCVEQSAGLPAVDFDFTKASPWISNTVVGDFCHPPIPIGQRGVYFDGKSSIKL